MREDYRWIWIPLVVSAIGLGSALLLSIDAEFNYAQEWVKALLQVGLVGIFGIVISIVLERFKDRLQKSRDESKLRFNVLTDLTRTYMKVKLVRRKLQQLQPASPITTKEDELNQLQVQIEKHKRVSVFLFQRGQDLKAKIESMEKYLNDVANQPASQARTGFLTHGFRDFSGAYKEAVEIIQEEIANG